MFLYFSVQTFTQRTSRWNAPKSEFQRAAQVIPVAIEASGTKSVVLGQDFTRKERGREEIIALESAMRNSPAS